MRQKLGCVIRQQKQGMLIQLAWILTSLSLRLVRRAARYSGWEDD